MNLFYRSGLDDKRAYQLSGAPRRQIDKYMSAFRKDFSRVVYSPSFRRLQGKSQLFPATSGNPFFRNRLTHSIEVSNIANSIAGFLNKKHDALSGNGNSIDYNVVAFAGLAHDLGHPPFGHSGEKELNKLMKEYGGFEGNAQTLRILTTLERRLSAYHDNFSKRSVRDLTVESGGLNLTYRSLASVLKYDKLVGEESGDRLPGVPSMKGYYKEDKDLIDSLRSAYLAESDVDRLYSVECQIMDLADDIAYSTFDLEDCLKAEFLHPLDFLTSASDDRMRRIVDEVNNGLKKRGINEVVDDVTVVASILNVFERMFEFSPHSEYRDLQNSNADRALFASITHQEGVELSRRGYLRREFSMQRIQNSIQSVDIFVDETTPILTSVRIEDIVALEIECLKAYNFSMVIDSPELRRYDQKGRTVVHNLFNILMNNLKLLPSDERERLEISIAHSGSIENSEARAVCDFIAGMTDAYAIELHDDLGG